ncbi:hypothetical protein HY408_01170 [Candidatus Gottesmanbacteria bacterium]|nr:hypothetical protein [Candidatus Gottesmanbacteria bacterium]
MTSISHALIGAAIASKIPNPYLAGTLAFATHFLCDMIPHWDLGTNWRKRSRFATGTLAIIETCIAMFGTYTLFSIYVPNTTTLALAIVASLLPDWLEVPYYILLPHPPKVFYYIYRTQSYLHSRLQAPMGILTQMIVVGVFLGVGFLL